jgi:pyruvate ferredoxin oxidoreductase beta subunit
MTFDVAKLAVETGLYPLFEYEYGKLISRKIPKIKPVEEYLKVQGRFKHLLKDPDAIKQVQAIADYNIEKYGLRSEA